MGPVELAAAAAPAIVRLGGGFMLSSQARDASQQLGVGGWSLYHLGRGGVLGDVDPAVVAAAFGFIPVGSVAKGWTKGRPTLAPDDAVRAYAEVCHRWGRAHLTGVEGLERLAALLERAVVAADAAGRPLFAGWAAQPLPDDAPARVAQLCHVLREHRGAGHLMAVLTSGLTPLEAVLLANGEGGARFFAWPEPYPDVEHLRGRLPQVQAATDELAAAPWTALDDDERSECLGLLQAAHAAAG